MRVISIYISEGDFIKGFLWFAALPQSIWLIAGRDRQHKQRDFLGFCPENATILPPGARIGFLVYNL